MSSYVIKGGKRLNGVITNSGSKNASLPILATALLNPNPVTFYNIPDIEDVRTTLKILRILGCKITRKCDKITISSANLSKTEIPKELMHRLRSTVILAGALIGRFKEATFSFPGGCNIGARPIDLHIEAFKRLGIDIKEYDEKIVCKADKIKANKIKLKFPSVGATENSILASIYTEGTTQIINSAREPEIRDLANCLNKMGAKVYGAGTSKITVIGVKNLYKTSYRVMPDRIEAGTYLCAAAITKGRIRIENSNPKDLMEVLYKLKEIGCKIAINKNDIILNAPKKLKATNIKTSPYPGFPTDMQQIFTTVLTKTDGKSLVEENIFENRFLFCNELIKMGANIQINNNHIEITGTNKLHGSIVKSNDLRGGAALVIAGLSAKGTTTVENVEYIARGYEKVKEKLTGLGAEIKLV